MNYIIIGIKIGVGIALLFIASIITTIIILHYKTRHNRKPCINLWKAESLSSKLKNMKVK